MTSMSVVALVCQFVIPLGYFSPGAIGMTRNPIVAYWVAEASVLSVVTMPTPLHRTSLTKSLMGVYRVGKRICLRAIGLGRCCLLAMFGLQLYRHRVVQQWLMPKRRLGIV
jgi:hypothetical protein